MLSTIKNIKDIMIPSCENVTKADPDLTVAVIMFIFQSQLMTCLSYNKKSRTLPKMEEKLLQLLHMCLRAHAHRHKIAASVNESY